MPARREGKISAVRTGLAHLAISVATLAGLSGAAAGAIHVSGDARDAGPAVQLAMFESDPAGQPPALKTRLADRTLPLPQMAAMQPVAPDNTAREPSLVAAPAAGEEAGWPTAHRQQTPPEGSADPRGVRINGRTVLPGEALSEVEQLDALPRSPIEGLHEWSQAGHLPVIAEDGQRIADAYARPFYARAGQPTVSLVLGGLGINYTHTRSAIEELPPEVTLSFAPHARGLQTWIRRAREAGHEVLIELPLEPYEHGRVRPHANTLKAGDGPAANTARLERTLRLGHGYFGVINYQGDKFATSPQDVRAMFEALESRGVAFIEDGSLSAGQLQGHAGAAGALYARADAVVDARIDADAIRSELMALETRALEEGGALGTAIAYPLSIDIVKEWTAQLPEKGLVLAPASSLMQVPAVEGEAGPGLLASGAASTNTLP